MYPGLYISFAALRQTILPQGVKFSHMPINNKLTVQ